MTKRTSGNLTVIMVLGILLGCGKASAAEGLTQPEKRLIRFSGYTWWVKASEGPVGPGPNYFSDHTRHVWLDDQGRLHLRIDQDEERKWRCAEVVNTASLGHGRYHFAIDSPLDGFDPNVVLGLFTWSDDPAFSHREIDFECARWGNPTNWNAQFVVQPYTSAGHIERFLLPEGQLATGHRFDWRKDRVVFRSIRGHDWEDTHASPIIHEWLFEKKSVPAGGENVRINLWLYAEKPPSSPTEVIIRAFRFEANEEAAASDRSLSNP